MGEGYKPLIDHSHFMGHSSFAFPRHEMPAANVARHEKKLVVDVAVPGFAKEDLEVTIRGRVLTVKGQREKHVEAANVEYMMEEFSMDSFKRKFHLTDDLSDDQIEANYENGVLRISFFDDNQETDKKVHKIEIA